MNEKQLSTFSVLLSEFFSEDGIIFSKCGIDNAILDKLYQLDYAIDGSEPDIIKRHFIVLFDNIYRSLSTSDTEKSKSLLDLLKILRREII
ncbi:MAG: hypothetical protein LBD88_04565 [Candidatus Peribacteria bacterium]|jgi:hypothetical protein|nr:hypothetical protein [Candidatus Peribacteria bacterium]